MILWLYYYASFYNVSEGISVIYNEPGYAYNGYILIKDSNYSDAATFKTAMSGVQLCYELATPLTYQLTGQDIITLVGDNYIWSDSGDVTITE